MTNQEKIDKFIEQCKKREWTSPGQDIGTIAADVIEALSTQQSEGETK